MTFWLGQRIGEQGLARYGSEQRIGRLLRAARGRGAAALAATALTPPPFPLTLLVLTCGALRVDRRRFSSALGAAQLLRYGLLSLLALAYGAEIVTWLEAPLVRHAVAALLTAAAVGTLWSLLRLLQRPLGPRAQARHAS